MANRGRWPFSYDSLNPKLLRLKMVGFGFGTDASTLTPKPDRRESLETA